MFSKLLAPSVLVVLVLMLIAAPAAATDKKLVKVTNTTGSSAAGLTIVFTGAGSDINISPYSVIVSTGGCGIPMIPSNVLATGTAVILWPSACVPPGAVVTFVAATTSAGPLSYVPSLAMTSYWTSATGTILGSVSPSTTVTALTPPIPPPPFPPPPLIPPITVTVKATVASPETGVASVATIGTISAGATLACDAPIPPVPPSGVSATFDLAPAYTWLDGAYDLKFVQVMAAYIVGGDHAGTSFPAANVPAFPAIDPAPCFPSGACVPLAVDYPGGDDLPYYTNGTFWPGAHTECDSSTMLDCPGLSPGTTDEALVYFTFLVVDDGDGTMLGPTEFCVLAGFAWYYDDSVLPGGYAAIIGAVEPGPALVAAALALSASPFPSWTAVSSCTLEAPMGGTGCLTPLPGAATSLAIWSDCAPKVGTTFTMHAKVAKPYGLPCPPGAGCVLGGSIIYAVALATLDPAFDLFGAGLVSAPGSCFLYVPVGALFASTGTLSDDGVWTQSILVPSSAALAGITFHVQAFQPVTHYPGIFGGAPSSGFAITPYLTETVVL